MMGGGNGSFAHPTVLLGWETCMGNRTSLRMGWFQPNLRSTRAGKNSWFLLENFYHVSFSIVWRHWTELGQLQWKLTIKLYMCVCILYRALHMTLNEDALVFTVITLILLIELVCFQRRVCFKWLRIDTIRPNQTFY